MKPIKHRPPSHVTPNERNFLFDKEAEVYLSLGESSTQISTFLVKLYKILRVNNLFSLNPFSSIYRTITILNSNCSVYYYNKNKIIKIVINYFLFHNCYFNASNLRQFYKYARFFVAQNEFRKLMIYSERFFLWIIFLLYKTVKF